MPRLREIPDIKILHSRLRSVLSAARETWDSRRTSVQGRLHNTMGGQENLMLQASGLRGRRRLRYGDRVLFQTLEPRRLFTTVSIDFDEDGAGTATTPGQVIDDEYQSLGVTITTQ